MNDRFRFRAKDKKTGEWVVGSHVVHLNRTPSPLGDGVKPVDFNHYVCTSGSSDWNMPRPIIMREVLPETIGQCAGLKDKNGRLIYEGDILVPEKENIVPWIVLFNDGIFWAKCGSDKRLMRSMLYPICIGERLVYGGNAHDNPELLEVVK